jgi:hypothetical protein
MRKDGVPALGDARPALTGFDPVVAGLHMLTNQVISMRMESGNAKIKHLPGPLFPMEIAEDRIRQFAKRKREDVIEQAQAKARARQQKAVTSA